MRKFTRQELLAYDGTQGRPIYVACEGKVYDLTDCFTWRNGYHQLFHRPGTDLTDALSDAPHGNELLSRYPVVGLLID